MNKAAQKMGASMSKMFKKAQQFGDQLARQVEDKLNAVSGGTPVPSSSSHDVWQSRASGDTPGLRETLPPPPYEAAVDWAPPDASAPPAPEPAAAASSSAATPQHAAPQPSLLDPEPPAAPAQAAVDPGDLLQQQLSSADFGFGGSDAGAATQSSAPGTFGMGGSVQGSVQVASLAAEGEGAADDSGNPQRAAYRAQRLAKKAQRIQAKLEEQWERDTKAAFEEAERHEAADLHSEKLRAWEKSNQGNIRSLLAHLESVLWEGSGLKPVGIMDLVEASAVKKAFRRAIVVVHPDKVIAKGGTSEQKYVASFVYDVLNQAWVKFSSEEL